jgi:hypothetical protein
MFFLGSLGALSPLRCRCESLGAKNAPLLALGSIWIKFWGPKSSKSLNALTLPRNTLGGLLPRRAEEDFGNHSKTATRLADILAVDINSALGAT